MPRVEAFARDALRPAATREARAPHSVLASDPLCACTCLPLERSPSCRPGQPSTVQFAIARPVSAAYCGPPPNPPVSPDPQETARCMPASSCPQTRTLSVIWESSVSARTLVVRLSRKASTLVLFALATTVANAQTPQSAPRQAV